MEHVIQYVPFSSCVHPSFWHTLTQMKLDVDKLNETTKRVFGKFTYREDIGTVFEVDGTSFNSEPNLEHNYENVTGTIMNKNTIEEFKNIDKASLLNSVGEMISADIKKHTWITKPSSLINFFVLTFADLKKYHYYYWFAFPSPSQPTVQLKESSIISKHFDKQQIQTILSGHKTLTQDQRSFFVVDKDRVGPLATVFSDEQCDLSGLYLGFLDPSNGDSPGWPLRLFIAAILEHSPNLVGKDVNFIGVRYSTNGTSINNSRVFTVHIPKDVSPSWTAWVGWERNDKGNFGPRLSNMSASMDPIILADTSSDLNIKLMKWRLAPDLDINIMKQTKCLLLGAGTLGCHVARDLLAWGFREITFVDNGKVSFSNPTRQVLFNYQDCLGGGKKKAEAAAHNLKMVLPSVKTRGLNLHIPMPGHPVGESLKAETIANIETLTEAISSHDVVFLLLDTREARWLPTLIAAHFGKIVINAALGFDSYLVMRHGVHASADSSTSGGDMRRPVVAGTRLGCYFCNDVTAPGNSLRDRTLDQQCTVTRPGVAAIAGALAVELLVGLLQHPLKAAAPALYNLNDNDDKDIPEVLGVLGHIPHSIRGFLHSYQNIVPTCVKFKQCIACSDAILNKYREEGVEFILKACESGKYLEQVTGLEELQMTAELTDILTFSDEDEEN